jgi:hypothetical protein
METHVHGSGHDGKYKYGEMQCQNIDNQGARNCNQRTHMERNENSIYDYYTDAKKRKQRHPKICKKMIIRRPLK